MSVAAETHDPPAAATARPEPRAMTVLDLVVFVTGFAVMISLFGFAVGEETRIAMEVLRRGEVVGQSIGTLLGVPFLLISAATTLVVLERQYVYHRPARPAEWISLVSVAILVTGSILLSLFGANTPWQDSEEFPPTILGVTLIVLVAGFVALGYAQTSLPPWIKTLSIQSLIAIWIIGPVATISWYRMQLWRLLTPPGGGWIATETWHLLLRGPTVLLFGVPATATLMELSKGTRRWVWTEWTCAISMLCWYISCLLPTYWPTAPASTARQLMELVWLVGTLVISWAVIQAWRAFQRRWGTNVEADVV